jgi:predicted acylesterase/phospholipase RssA
MPLQRSPPTQSNGESVLLRSGDAGQSGAGVVRLLGVFVCAASIGGRELVDGGLTSPLPVQAARS